MLNRLIKSMEPIALNLLSNKELFDSTQRKSRRLKRVVSQPKKLEEVRGKLTSNCF